MPFDSEPAAEVTARDRMIRLRDFLAALPDERFDIRSAFTGNADALTLEVWQHACGTAACVGGWAQLLFPGNQPTGELLGLEDDDASALFMPPGWARKETARVYTRARAVATIDHYLATLDATGVGVIDWSVAADQPAKREREPAR